MMKNIGIIIETDKGKIKETNFGMITLARAKDSAEGSAEDTKLFAFVMAADANALKNDLESYGITKIVRVLLADEQQYNPVVRAKALLNAIKAYDISVVFGLTTAQGKDILPRIAALAEAPLVMDCSWVDLEENLATTSQYSGKTMARIKVTGKLLVFGIKPNAIAPVKLPGSAEIVEYDQSHLVSDGFRVIKAGEADKNAKVSLVEAEVIFAGGRGMKSSENFALLSRCAETINAGVAAGYEKGYLRKSVVAEPLNQRKNTGSNTPAIIHHNIVAGDKLSITVMAKGGGCENKSQFKMFLPTADKEQIAEWIVGVVASAGANACPPFVVGVGIGGNFERRSLEAEIIFVHD